MAGDHLTPGTPAFRAAAVGLFAAGFGTFGALYCVQPLLPQFAKTFGVGAAGASLVLSTATFALAVSMLVMSVVSDRLGRKSVMAVSLFAAGALTLVAAAWPGWSGLLILRGLTGVALSGVPAVAMAYLGEEVDRPGLPRAMGLYISGTALGGLSGRLTTGVMLDVTGSWRLALGVVGLLVLVCGVGVLKLLPASRHFSPSLPRLWRAQVAIFGRHLRDPVMARLFAVGFMLLGGFVVVFNYTGFRLLEAPYGLSESMIGAVFFCYLLAGPATATMGRASLRFGRGQVLTAAAVLMLAGAGLTLAEPLPLVILGVSMMAFGVFGCHALAGAWVTERAVQARSQASALYLFFYYMGSSFLGPLGGVLWTVHRWPGVAALLAAIVLLQGLLSASLIGARERAP